jgi:hypothetical protein
MDTFPTYPVFKFNNSFPSAKLITQHAGTPHGLTLSVLNLIDSQNVNLRIDVTCSGTAQIEDYSELIACILQKINVVKIYFRTVKVNGVYQDTFANSQLERDDTAPFDIALFKNNAEVICDIESDTNKYVVKIWRKTETTARTLTLTSESPQISLLDHL